MVAGLCVNPKAGLRRPEVPWSRSAADANAHHRLITGLANENPSWWVHVPPEVGAPFRPLDSMKACSVSVEP